MNIFKDKELFIILSILIIFPIAFYTWQWKSQSPTLADMCHESNGGWAPVGPIEFAPIDADGKRLTADSPLIDRSYDRSGYTCWCHTPNTGWNGKECVPIPEN